MKRNFEILRNEAGGGEGGGGAAPVATATPEAAPSASPEATPAATTPEPTGGTPDVFTGQPVTPAAGEQSTPVATPTEGDVFRQLYTAENQLAENYTEILKANGMENLTNTVTKYNSPNGLLKGAANLINFAGKKVEGVVVPTEGASEQEIADYHKAIGVPESATAYDIKPETMPEGLEWDDARNDRWSNKFHTIGISQEQAAEISAEYSAELAEMQVKAKTDLAQAEAQKANDQQAVKQKEWGESYGKNMEASVNMATTLGFDLDNADDMTAVRNPKVLNLLLDRHNSLKEGSMPRGGETVPNGKGFGEQANDIYQKYPRMDTAPPDVRAKYQELRKLQAKGS